jgi:DNA-binding CsgD family transcriptional regulator
MRSRPQTIAAALAAVPESNAEKVLRIFTPRERDVWLSIATGHTTKETASLLGISAKTVEHYRGKLYHKCQARNIADLTRLAVQYGVIKVEVAA